MPIEPGFFNLAEDTDKLPVPTTQTNSHLTLLCGDCHELLDLIDEESVALALFSPPYDVLRSYGDAAYAFDLRKLGHQIHRVLKPGGVAVMVIQDQTADGRKSLTTFETIVYWANEVGFTPWETLIYHRHGAPGNQWRHRFRIDHEYMPVFVKGPTPAYFNKTHMTERAITAGQVLVSGAAKRLANGEVSRSRKSVVISADKARGSIWKYNVATDLSNQDARMKFSHPATYPDKLAWDHILCWTQPGDVVLDPFIGSGSTAVAALAAGRDCIGFDVNADYIALAQERCNIITAWSKP